MKCSVLLLLVLACSVRMGRAQSATGFLGSFFANLFRRTTSTTFSETTFAQPLTMFVTETMTMTETSTETMTETETSTLSLSWLRWTTETEREFMTETVTETTTSVDVSLLVSVAVVTLTEKSTSFSVMTETMTTTTTQTMVSEYVVTEPMADCPTYTVSLQKKKPGYQGYYQKTKEILLQDDIDEMQFDKKREDETGIELMDAVPKKAEVDIDIDDLVPSPESDKPKLAPKENADFVNIDDLDLVDGFLRRTAGSLM